MKLRIKGNSIRFRLTQTEVTTLATEGIVLENIQFLDSKLQYALKTNEQASIVAHYQNQMIQVTIPNSLVQNWASTDLVGLQHEEKLPEGQSLSILIEKDFKCLTDRPTEDESDNYPHPNEHEMSC